MRAYCYFSLYFISTWALFLLQLSAGDYAQIYSKVILKRIEPGFSVVLSSISNTPLCLAGLRSPALHFRNPFGSKSQNSLPSMKFEVQEVTSSHLKSVERVLLGPPWWFLLGFQSYSTDCNSKELRSLGNGLRYCTGTPPLKHLWQQTQV